MSDDTRSHSRSMLVVSGGVLLSRVLGLARDVLFAFVWGTGAAMDAFAFAFMVPNLFRALFGEGAFTGAFVPVFSDKLEREGKEAAWRAACRVVSVLAVVLGAATLLVMLGCLAAYPWVTQEYPRRILLLTALFMPYAPLICLAVALAGVLNTFHRFTITSLTPLLLNLLFIVGAAAAWWWCPPGGADRGVWLLVPAVLAAGVLHVGCHVWAARRGEGLAFRFMPDFRAPEVRRMAVLMAPMLLGSGMIQFNAFLDRFWAAILGGGAVSALYYSQRIIYLPVGLFGVASSVVALPAMSRAWARGDQEGLLEQLSHALRKVLFMCLPMTVLMMVLADPLVRLFFQRGSFTDASVNATLLALVFYLPGIPFFSLVKPLATGFYARQDTRTPVRVAWVCLGLNLVLNLSLMWWLRQGGLALSTTIAAAVNLVTLLVLFRRQTGLDVWGKIRPAVVRMAVAAAVAAAVAWMARRWLSCDWAAAGLQHRVAVVAVPLVVGYAVYGVAALALGCEEGRELVGDLTGKLARRWPRIFGYRA